MWSFIIETLAHEDQFSHLFLNLDTVLNNLTPGQKKKAKIWEIDQVWINVIKLQFIFLGVFTDVHFVVTLKAS